MSEPANLAGAIIAETARNRELLVEYKKLGPAGAFGAAMIEQGLQSADRAMVTGDVAEMVKAYKALRETQ